MLLTMPTPAHAAARSAGTRRLRVLVLDEALPYPTDSGKRLRTWHLLTRLARRHDITLLCYAGGGAAGETAGVEALRAAGVACQLVSPPLQPKDARLYLHLLANLVSPWPYSVAKHHSPAFQAAVEELCERGDGFDLIQVEWTPYASHLHPGLPPHLIASHNIETQIWQRRAAAAGNWAAQQFFFFQAAKMRRFERRAFAQACWVTTVSEQERATALAWGAPHASVVANGVDLEAWQPRLAPAPQPDRLVFCGALDWFANEDAVRYFARAILPRIRARRPAVHLQVVGRRPPAALVRALADTPGLALVGEVADVRPYLEAAAAVVVPLRIGGGSRIKILEALAMAKPVISTRIGAEGLAVEDGSQLLLADAPEDFAHLTLQLLAVPSQGQRLGATGRRWVQEHHGWDQCAQALEQAWRQAAPVRP